MSDIVKMITDTFVPLGMWGSLLIVFMFFFVDAILIPTFPEVVAILAFTQEKSMPTALFGTMILVTIVLAEVAGLTVLYLVVKKVKIPNRMQKAVRKYQSFLVYPDERMILVNRAAPLLPFLGAFVALCEWSYARSVKYVVLGGAIKYGAILLIAGLSITLMDQGTALLTTMVLVILVIVISFWASYYRKRSIEKNKEILV